MTSPTRWTWLLFENHNSSFDTFASLCRPATSQVRNEDDKKQINVLTSIQIPLWHPLVLVDLSPSGQRPALILHQDRRTQNLHWFEYDPLLPIPSAQTGLLLTWRKQDVFLVLQDISIFYYLINCIHVRGGLSCGSGHLDVHVKRTSWFFHLVSMFQIDVRYS